MDDRKKGTPTRTPSKVTVITQEPGRKPGRETSRDDATARSATQRRHAERPVADRRTRPTKRRRPELSAEEERILRMRYGIAGDSDLELEFEGKEFDDTRLQLALIERRALEMMSRKGGPNGPTKGAGTKKDKIIRKLREI